jgi:hypothetical protein
VGVEQQKFANAWARTRNARPRFFSQPAAVEFSALPETRDAHERQDLEGGTFSLIIDPDKEMSPK